MQPILESLGITDRSVKQMSQAEKEILRYLATMQQAQIAMGDLANTIESPSNQLKVFRQQLVETKVAISSLFMGLYSNVLPYANAFLMVVKEMAKALANLFGIELSDYNTGIASQEGIYDGIEESADGATEAVKELKRQTLGFDEIHNINENTDSGSGSASVSGGIDQRLLDAITGYDNGMESVRMKATEIRDRIMEWLGFTKEIDPLTGEVSFKYQGMQTTLKKMWTSFKGLSTTGKTLVGLGLVIGATKLWNVGKKLVTSLGAGTGLLGITKKLLSPMSSLGGLLKDDLAGGFHGLTGGISDSITMWSKSLTAMDKFKVGLAGVLGLSLSMSGMESAMQKVSNEGWNLGNSLQTVASGLGGIASGAYIGSIFGTWGTVIGGAAGAVLELISAIDGYDSAGEKMVENAEENLRVAEQNLQNYYDTKKAIEDSMNSELAIQEYSQRLLDELNSLVDVNGRVKEGYEDRVNFILNELNSAYGTEYSIINGTINEYDDLNKTIQKVIDTKKSEIMLDANKKAYTDAITDQTRAWKLYNDAIKDFNETNDKANELLNKKVELEELAGTTAYRNYEYYSELTDRTYKGMDAYAAITRELGYYNETLSKNQDTISETGELFERYTNDIVFYEDLQTAVLTENTAEQKRLIEERLKTIETENGKEKLTFSEQLDFYQSVADTRLEILKKNGVEITDEMIKQAETQKTTLIDNLVEQSKTIEGLSDGVVSSWKDLAENSSSEFAQAFNSLPEEIQNELLPKLKLTGTTLGDAISSGVKFNGSSIFSGWNDTVTTLYNTASGFASTFGFKLPSLSTLKINVPRFANGGIPEDGLFFANHTELVGKFSNGKTAVANNEMIIDGIKAGVYEAMAMAISQYSGTQSDGIEVHVHTDEGTVIDRIERRTKQTGKFPLTIPTQ